MDSRLAANDAEALYPETFLDSVARKFRIPEGQARAELRGCAVAAAEYYYGLKALVEERPAAEAAAVIFLAQQSIEQAMRALELVKAALPFEYHQAGQQALEEHLGRDLASVWAAGGVRKFEDEETRFYTPDDYAPVLKLLARHCECMAAILKPPRGPKRRVAMRGWAKVLCGYWREVLGRPVTLVTHTSDKQERQGITEAYRFLAALLEPLEPRGRAKRHLRTVVAEERTPRRR